MQIAALLSDLKSLSACDHESALALVTVHKSDQQQPSQPDSKLTLTTTTTSPSSRTDSPDLARAKDLIALHYGVKVNSGIDADLRQARADVNRVLMDLHRKEAR